MIQYLGMKVIFRSEMNRSQKIHVFRSFDMLILLGFTCKTFIKCHTTSKNLGAYAACIDSDQSVH